MDSEWRKVAPRLTHQWQKLRRHLPQNIALSHFPSREVSLGHIKKQSFLFVIDALLIIFAFWFSLWLKFDRQIPFNSVPHWLTILLAVPLSLLLLKRLGFYRTLVRYASSSLLKHALVSAFFSTLIVILSAFFNDASLPRTVPILYFFILVTFLTGSRFLCQIVLEQLNERGTAVIIYGAGVAGRQLLNVLRTQPHRRYTPVAFLDDDSTLHLRTIHGIPVYPHHLIDEVIRQHQVEKILLAIPSIPVPARRHIIDKLKEFPCEILTIPSFNDLVEGKNISILRPVSIDDLLGRDPIPANQTLLAKDIQGKSVLVTGAGGSIGAELCQQIIAQAPTTLILFELCEYALYNIEQTLTIEIQRRSLPIRLIAMLGDIKDQTRVTKALRCYHVDTVYHAAAYKHVPLVEANAIEGIKNNVFGTLALVHAVTQSHVEKFVLISSDKAVRPTNVMGATKRFAELILQAFAQTHPTITFTMVRFGNVLGSSGSVVPLFTKQIAQGGPITLTHKEITRFFMTIPEAAQLVIQAGAMSKSGEVFILDMGEPVRVYDLACNMVKLSGLRVSEPEKPGDIKIVFTGLRPGEKLYEELLIGPNVRQTAHKRIMKAQESFVPWHELELILKELIEYMDNDDFTNIRHLLTQKCPLAYHPSSEIIDVLA